MQGNAKFIQGIFVGEIEDAPDFFHQVVEADSADGRDQEYFAMAGGFELVLEFGNQGIFGVEGVEFVEGDDLGAFGEGGAIGVEFGLDGVVGGDRVFAGDVDQVE